MHWPDVHGLRSCPVRSEQAACDSDSRADYKDDECVQVHVYVLGTSLP